MVKNVCGGYFLMVHELLMACYQTVDKVNDHKKKSLTHHKKKYKIGLYGRSACVREISQAMSIYLGTKLSVTLILRFKSGLVI